MTALNLERVFQPKSIAVIGASERPGSVGAAVLQNLEGSGFAGDVIPVNPRYGNIGGRKCFARIDDVKAPVDLAVLTTPIETAPAIVRACVKAGGGGAVILSAGGKEIGEKGRRIEAAILQEAEGTGFRIVGPNCLGILCTKARMNASFGGSHPMPGKVAFISQSGAICTAVVDLSVEERIGFSHVISLGSMLDVDFGDVIDYLGGDPAVESIVMYVESLTRFRNLMSAARAVSRVKPIVALKAGRSRAGARAAASHTGALAGEDAVYDAAFERAGIVRVKTFEELFDCAALLAKQPRPPAAGLAIVTNAEIRELDINPLIVSADRCVAVDARVVLGESDRPAPLHMVISPYPNHHEARVKTDDGISLLLRPIRPEDAPLLVSLFEQLSPRSVYFRFFSPLKQIPHRMLARFTQIDYDRQIALAAIEESGAEDRMLGVARVMAERNPKRGEFAVLVGDAWQGKGIGAQLLLRCLQIAKEMGMETVSGIVLAENTQMLALGRKLGFTVGRAENFSETTLSIDLDSL